MTKFQYDLRLQEELNFKELIFINPNIYENPEHVIYFTKYKLADYDFCYKYILQHRHLLNINHTPIKWKSKMEQMLAMFK